LLPGFGSVVPELTVAVPATCVPSAVVGSTRTTTVSCAVAPLESVPSVQVTVPMLPGAGVVHVPLVVEADTKLVCAGTPKLTVAPTPRLAVVQVIGPTPPTGGAAQLQPPGADSDSKVVPDGTASCSWSEAAGVGPLLATTIV